MNRQGKLVVNVATGNGSININNAKVILSNEKGFVSEAFTAFNGKTNEIILLTNRKDENNFYYDNYFVDVLKDGFEPILHDEIKIYENTTSYLPLLLEPSTTLPINNNETIVEVASTTDVPRRRTILLEKEPYIPTNITVHLGPPNSNAEDVTVSFTYYVKNVASSEIYPTWPIEALRANIAAIISLALNRIHTKWYESRGYSFQITNNTQFDQKFIKNRNIFDSISLVVDEVFNTYIQKGNNLEPYFSSYCDGRQVTCDGMSQWGSYELALQGLNALEILQYYYGNDVQLVSTNNIQDIEETYPGRALKRGDSGNDVYWMQYCLNRIAIDYPNIYKIYPANGIFSLRMEQSVKEFQRQFNLTVDGIIGKATWYKIGYIFISVTKLAQLESEGIKLGEAQIEYRGEVLRQGSTGEEVAKLQYLLLSISDFYTAVIPLTIDGNFGKTTKQSVESFQKYFSLPVDGIVGEQTWNAIKTVFLSIFELLPNVEETIPYPNVAIRLGSNGDYVEIIQTYLNYISAFYSEIDQINVDGIYGEASKKQVESFQRLFNLPVTGVVNEETWNSISEVYRLISAVVLYPGFALKQGDSNRYVAYLQIYLNDIASINENIPSFVIDGIYGDNTEKAVRAFQREYGLIEDGIVGNETWNEILTIYLRDVRDLAEINISNSNLIQTKFLYSYTNNENL